MAVYKSITFDNRKKIAALYAKGMSISDISDEVGVALRTLYVELKRGATGKLDQNQRPAYDPVAYVSLIVSAYKARDFFTKSSLLFFLYR